MVNPLPLEGKAKEQYDEAIRPQFTDAEWAERKRHIITLQNCANAAIAAANALREIRDKRLYRPYASMKEFCERECRLSRQRAYQLISFATLMESLPPKCQPGVDTEKQARALLKVAPEHREAVLNEAVAIGKPTAPLITQISKKYEKEPEKIYDKGGWQIPKGTAQRYWARRPEAEDVMRRIQAVITAVKALDETDVMWYECHLDRAANDLHGVWKLIKDGMPSYVCLKCQGMDHHGCESCKGRRMIGGFQYRNQSLSELRNQREAECQRITKT